MSLQPATLLKLPNLIVKGRYYPITSASGSQPVTIEYECIELDFTILVNGRMANFQNSFIIQRSEIEIGSYTLADFGEWYLILRILLSLGYSISEDVKWEHQFGESNPIIKRWINILREGEIGSGNIVNFQNTEWVHGTTCSGTESMKTAIN